LAVSIYSSLPACILDFSPIWKGREINGKME
jgi:hypothetical protein